MELRVFFFEHHPREEEAPPQKIPESEVVPDFEVNRDDWRAFLRGRLDERYRWGLEYRDVDFQEGGIEDFRARLVEVSVGVDW